MVSIVKSGLAQGITITVGTPQSLPIYGRTFNPPGIPISGWTSWAFINEAYTFDCTNLYPGHEVLLYAIHFQGPFGGGTARIRWYDPTGFWWSYISYSVPALGDEDEYLIFEITGFKPPNLFDAGEIIINGTHYAKFYLNDVEMDSQSFEITNLVESRWNPLLPIASIGYIWVEGENIWFVSRLRTKHPIKHDGSSTFVGTANAGYIWVSEFGSTLEYVDQNGYKRRTHTGDTIGPIYFFAPPLPGDVPGNVGSDNAGYIWAHNGFNICNLVFVNSNGDKVRIGNGYAFGSGY